eukprot:TRINITY_DN197_c0_g1_i15.p1 TRINITY_DN197_c0_g1~~TRINITY_DN197_c0_g1_i15.p1  ORF type:complete len:171 (+),score=33.85 TRINITY_DN197_c0_g1_i15:172-684(+)
MKLFLTVVLASLLMMKAAEVDAVAVGGDCNTDACTADTGTECTGVDGSKTCTCLTNYEQPTPADGTCKLANGQACTAATAAVCATAICDTVSLKCGKANGEACTMGTDCATAFCDTAGSKKCGLAKDAVCVLGTDCASLDCKELKCAAGAAGVVASVLLMVVTLMTSRIL